MISLADLPVHARLFVKRTPLLYRSAKRLTGRGARDHLCDRTTDLCIEGYPSSGNSFSYAVLRLANERLRIAHHCHSVANLELALGYAIPAVCLIRDPENAITSRLARFGGDLRDAVLEYVDFYDFTLRHLDRLTVVTFEEVTQHTGVFLDRVARESGLPFAVEDVEALKPRAVAYLKQWTAKHGDPEKISLPVASRELSKAEFREAVRSERHFPDARRLWERITGQAEATS
ncbi:MAG: hypothetical protein WD407_11700 [Rhodospirillales bacterium]